MSSPLPVFPHFHILKEYSKIRIGIDSKGVDQDASGTIPGFDGIDNRHVIRIAVSFESVMLDDRQVVGLKRFSALHCSKHIVEQFEVGCKSSLLQIFKGFSHRLVGYDRHGLFLQKTSFLHTTRSRYGNTTMSAMRRRSVASMTAADQ